MFFSRARLNEYFRPLVNSLLGCECDDCAEARNDGNDMVFVSNMQRLLRSHSWLLGFMIYLGKLHYIYYWMRWKFFNLRSGLKASVKDEGHLTTLMASESGRSIFDEAYKRAISMFDPMTFEIHEDETCPYWQPHDSCRFPYVKEESISTTGFYGALTKVEILPEHLNPNMIEIMRRYPTSGTNAGGDRKVCHTWHWGVCSLLC